MGCSSFLECLSVNYSFAVRVLVLVLGFVAHFRSHIRLDAPRDRHDATSHQVGSAVTPGRVV